MVFILIPIIFPRFRSNVQPSIDQEYKLKIGLKLSDSIKTHFSDLIFPIVSLITVFGLLMFGVCGPDLFPALYSDYEEQDLDNRQKTWRYYAFHFLLPLGLMASIQLFSTCFAIFSWTKNNIRFAYKDVFYVTVFWKSLRFVFSLLMICSIFLPWNAYQSVPLDGLSLIPMWLLLNDLRTILFICGIFFNKDNFIKIITKYSFAADILWICYSWIIFGISLGTFITGLVGPENIWIYMTPILISYICVVFHTFQIRKILLAPKTEDDQKSTREEFIIHSIITLLSIPLYILMLLSIMRCRLYVIDILKNEPKRKLRDLDTLNPPYDIKIRSAIQIKQLMKEMNTVETEQETL